MSKNTPLNSLLKSKDYTMNDLKAEVILMLVENFISHYIYSEENGKSKNIFNDTNSENLNNQNEITFNRLKKLKSDLLELNILTISELNKKLRNSSLYTKTTLSPYTLMYNAGIDTFSKARKDIFNEDELKVWLPDVLAIHLIMDSKEEGINFEKFPCIHNDDFMDFIDFFTEINREFRKRDNSISSTKNPTMVMKTSRLSFRIVKKIVNFK